MAPVGAGRPPNQIIEHARAAYRERLPAPDPGWPADVRVFVDALHARLFDPDVRVCDVRAQNGLRDNNVSGRFRFYVGRPPRDYILHHRIELARRLLATTGLPVGDVALGVGWGSPGAFSTTFKRHVGKTPSAYRKHVRDGDE